MVNKIVHFTVPSPGRVTCSGKTSFLTKELSEHSYVYTEAYIHAKKPESSAITNYIRNRRLTVKPSISSWSLDLCHSAKWLSGPYTSLSSSTTRFLKKFVNRSLLCHPLWSHSESNCTIIAPSYVLHTMFIMNLIKKPAFNLQLPLRYTFALLNSQ